MVVANKISKRFLSASTSRCVLDRLAAGPVIGDGGFVFELEKRGYVKAGPWTPEANCEEPLAVKQLHTEFARAGANVMQTFTFYASEDKLENRGNYASASWGTRAINDEACKIAREVGEKYNALVAGGISQTPDYLSNKGKQAVQDQFRKQINVFQENGVDFMIAEYYEHIEETEWAIEACLEYGYVTAANMCIGKDGDLHGVSTGDCGMRMYEAGAKIVGLNCHFGPMELLDGMEEIVNAFDRNGVKVNEDVYLMVQPLAYHTPDATKQGFIDLPEFPFALEPRVATRYEMQQFARRAWDMGIRYIGGCCGFQPYHIRACVEELTPEIGGRYHEGGRKWEPNAEGLLMHTKPWVRARASGDYWKGLRVGTGRPASHSLSSSDRWGKTQGDAELQQSKQREAGASA